MENIVCSSPKHSNNALNPLPGSNMDSNLGFNFDSENILSSGLNESMSKLMKNDLNCDEAKNYDSTKIDETSKTNKVLIQISKTDL